MFIVSALFYRCQSAIGVYMATPATVTKFTDGIGGIRIFVFFMRPGFEITGVTSGAIRFEGCVCPIDILIISRVTIDTIE